MKMRCLTGLVALVAASAAAADTISVCADGCDHTSINAAVDMANDGDIIQLSAETYLEGEPVNTDGKAITLRGVNEVDENGHPLTRISGGDSHRVLVCRNDETSSTILEHLTISDGRADTDTAEYTRGGGLYCFGGSPLVRNCVFRNNTSSSGGATAFYGDSTAEIELCVFTENTATYGGGGAYVNTWSSSEGPSFTQCTFKANTCTYDGGAVHAYGTDLTLTDCTLTNNQANSHGGGVYANAGAQVVIHGGMFAENTARKGGAISHTSMLSISGSIIRDNIATDQATSPGGGIYNNSYNSEAILSATLLCGNIPDSASGAFTDNGENCISLVCTDTDGDGVPDCISNGNDPNPSVPDTYPSIERAIDAAAPGATVTIASGIYLPTTTLDGMGKAYTLQGTVTPDGTPSTVIDGDGYGVIIRCRNGESSSTSFMNLVISNAMNGVQCEESSPTIMNCIVRDHTNSGILNNDSEPTVVDTIFCNNTPSNISSPYVDGGGNCLSLTCNDSDGDGMPDCDGNELDDNPLVPKEYDSIERALDAATPGAIIEVSAGHYTPSITLNTFGKPITLRGEIDLDGRPTTIIDGQDTRQIIRCSSDAGQPMIFENLHITRGNSSLGGGAYCSVEAEFHNCVFEKNQAGNGGGMYLIGMTTLVDCRFIENQSTSSSNGGGGVCIGGSSPRLTRCTFQGNTAETAGGGAMVFSAEDAAFEDCVFIENHAGYTGGGVENWLSPNTTFSNTIACGNTPDQIHGDRIEQQDNCIRWSCTDADDDGLPDCLGGGTDPQCDVPGEYATIADALDAVTEGGVVNIEAGTYLIDASIDPLGKAATIRGTVGDDGTPATIIDGLGYDTYTQMIRCENGEGADTIFENLVIRGGQTNLPGGGAGLVCRSSDPTFRNCHFIENSFTGWYTDIIGGGAAALEDSDARFESCTFASNDLYTQRDTSEPQGGGGVLCSGGNPSFIDCSFIENQNLSYNDGGGGGLLIFGGCSATLDGCLFSANESRRSGGGLLVHQSSATVTNTTFFENDALKAGGGAASSDSPPHFNGCFFDGNTCSSGDGAAFTALDQIELLGDLPVLDACVFMNNEPSSYGSSVHIEWGELTNCTASMNGNSTTQTTIFAGTGATVRNCTITDNLGNGIETEGNSIIEGCLISGNNSTSAGGGIDVLNDGDPDKANVIRDCTIVGNQANSGGGINIELYVTCTVIDCTIQGNTATNQGGGIRINNSSGTLIEGCLITQNACAPNQESGGVFFSGTCGVSNTQICANTPHQAYGNFDDLGGVRVADYCENGDGVLEVPDEFPDIQAAVNAALAGELILVGPGTWTAPRGAQELIDTLGKAITIRSVEGPESTVLSGQDDTNQLVIFENGEGPDTVLEGFTITSADRYGIRCSNESAPHLINCVLFENPMGMLNVGSSPTLTDCRFIRNGLEGSYSGGMENIGSSPTLFSCLFEDNTNDRYGGAGGVKNTAASNPELHDCIFLNNSNTYGNPGAGGMLNDESDPRLYRCVFESNTSTRSGGGMSNTDSNPFLQDCDFILNTCTEELNSSGGGMYNVESEPQLWNCRFIDNYSAGIGGAISSFGNFTDFGPILDGCTLTGNYALIYGAIAGSNRTTLLNTFICGNGPAQTRSDYIDLGGNCVSIACLDTNGDGQLECPASEVDDYVQVPSEYPTIEEAIDAATQSATIEIASGRYLIASTLDLMGKNLTIRGATSLDGDPRTTIDAQGDFGVFFIPGVDGSNVTLENLVITGGHTQYNGGGLLWYSMQYPTDDTTLTIRNCIFEDNAARAGAGLAISSQYAYTETFIIDGCAFRKNTASVSGGAISFYQGSCCNLPIMRDNTICGNTEEQVIGDWTDDGGNTFDELCAPHCPADISEDGLVDGADLNILLGEWGQSASVADITGDGIVDGADLNVLLGAWGVCP